MTDSVYDAEFEPVIGAFEEEEDPNLLFERLTYHLVRLERKRRLRRRLKRTLLGLFLLSVTAGCFVAWDRYEQHWLEGLSFDPREWPWWRRWIQ